MSKPKHQIYLMFILSILMILSHNVSNAIDLKDFKVKESGYFHKDGSYQFSNSEVEKINELIKTTNRVNNQITMAEFLNYVSPDYYLSLPDTAKKFLHAEKWNINQHNTDVSLSNWMPGCTSSISKYGNSIRGYSETDRDYTNNPEGFQDLFIINYVEDYDTGEIVGSSMNYAFKSGFVSATTIVDPPSGKYRSIGYHEIPYYCTSCSEWSYMPVESYSGSISYVNPYE